MKSVESGWDGSFVWAWGEGGRHVWSKGCGVLRPPECSLMYVVDGSFEGGSDSGGWYHVVHVTARAVLIQLHCQASTPSTTSAFF